MLGGTGWSLLRSVFVRRPRLLRCARCGVMRTAPERILPGAWQAARLSVLHCQPASELTGWLPIALSVGQLVSCQIKLNRIGFNQTLSNHIESNYSKSNRPSAEHRGWCGGYGQVWTQAWDPLSCHNKKPGPQRTQSEGCRSCIIDEPPVFEQLILPAQRCICQSASCQMCDFQWCNSA